MNTNRKPGGYQNLFGYQIGLLLYELNMNFCKSYLCKIEYKRTVEQMIQAARSGKQNIVEGSMANSVENYLKLLGVSRASFGELKEDYVDYLNVHKLKLWFKNDPRVTQIRQLRLTKNFEENKKLVLYFQRGPESFANLMITIIYREIYILGQLLKALESKFICEGGFRENLFKKRNTYRDKSYTRKL